MRKEILLGQAYRLKTEYSGLIVRALDSTSTLKQSRKQ